MTATTNFTSNPEQISLWEKISYGFGDLGSNILLDIGTLYLLKFYTDQLGIPGTYGGIIFLIAKFFTAFTDMGTGIVLDSRKKIGTRGKFRPFILYASIPVMLLTIANFVDTGALFHAGLGINLKTIIATILFMIYGIFFSLMNCPFGAMIPAITKDPNQRAQLAAFRQGGATIGLLVSTVCFIPLYNLLPTSSSLSYIITSAIFAIIGMIFMWLCYAGVKERYISIQKTQADDIKNHKSGSNILSSFKAISGNKPLFVLCIANFCTLAGFNIKLAVQIYYTQYVLHDANLISYMGFFSMVCVFIGVFLVPSSVKKYGKKSVYIAGLILWVVGDILNFTCGSTTLLFVIFSCLAFFGTAFVNSLNWAMVSDTVEYGEWKSGIRSEGTIYTGFTFFRKISQAVAGFFPGFMLSMIGYIPNVEQSLKAISGIRQLIFIYPCILAVITIIAIMFFYTLTESNYLKIVTELNQRNKNT